MTARDPSRHLYAQGTLREDGTFVVRGLPPGRYEVSAHLEASGVEPVRDVAAGARDVVLRARSR